MYLTVCSNSRVAFNFFFFTHTPTTEIYTLSLHDALPISIRAASAHFSAPPTRRRETAGDLFGDPGAGNFDQDTAIRSEEHTSELQSRLHLVCRLLLEKKKKKNKNKPKTNLNKLDSS